MCHRFEHIILRPEILQARRVIEQLADGDGVAAADPGQPFGDTVVEAKFALIFQQQQAHRGELFGVGGDLVTQVRRRCRDGFGRLTIGLGQYDLTVADDGDRGRGHTGFGQCLVDQHIDRSAFLRG